MAKSDPSAGETPGARVRHWRVEVYRDGENVVNIESNCLSGRELQPGDEEVIRDAAMNLLGFIGEPREAADQLGVVPPSPASDDVKSYITVTAIQTIGLQCQNCGRTRRLGFGDCQCGSRVATVVSFMWRSDDPALQSIGVAPRPAGGWQPIETAPKDGRDVFIYEDGVWPAVNVARFERFSDGSMGWISKCTIWPRDTASCMLRPRLWHPMIELPPSLGVPPPSPETDREVEALRQRIAWLEGTAMPHARKQENANGFQKGWHAALIRVRFGDDIDAMTALVPAPPPSETETT